MENRILRAPSGALLRLDVVGLQSSLLQCRSLAKQALELVKTGKNADPQIVSLLDKIADAAYNGVCVAKEYAEDYDVQYIQELQISGKADKTGKTGEVGKTGKTGEAGEISRTDRIDKTDRTNRTGRIGRKEN